MKIGIDARLLTHPQAGGFKAYTQNLLAALAQTDHENEYLLYVDRVPPSGEPIPDAPNFRVKVVPGSVPLIGMPWREQVGLSRQAARDKPDLWHSLCLTAPLRLPCPSVVTIHDMIWRNGGKYGRRRRPSVKRGLMDWYYRTIPLYAARRAAAVITVSQASKNSIVEEMELSPDRVFVTLEAAGCHFRPSADPEAIEAMRRRQGLSGGYLLALGSADPRKNMMSLVRAYAALPRSVQEQHSLAIVWTSDTLHAELTSLIEALGIEERVRYLRSVSDEELVLLYGGASLFVFPSLQEGFGLPVLEAMACGTPVVAGDNSSIPEIAGRAALLIPATETQALADAIAQVLSDETLRLRMRADGLAQAAQFSWARCARQTMQVYEHIGK